MSRWFFVTLATICFPFVVLAGPQFLRMTQGGLGRGSGRRTWALPSRSDFARPGNRFWPVLHKAGFTERQFSPFEERKLLKHGYGIMNIVNKATAAASELSRVESEKGCRRLKAKVRRCRPCVVAVLGL